MSKTATPDLAALVVALRNEIPDLAKDAREEIEAHREWLIENYDQPDHGCELISIHPNTAIRMEALLDAYAEQGRKLANCELCLNASTDAEEAYEKAHEPLHQQIADQAATIAALTAEVERLKDGLKALVRDSMASDFNEHWASYIEAQALTTQGEG